MPVSVTFRSTAAPACSDAAAGVWFLFSLRTPNNRREVSIRIPVPTGQVLHGGMKGDPDVHALCGVAAESGRHHAGDNESYSVNGNAPSGQPAIAPKCARPEGMAENGGRLASWCAGRILAGASDYPARFALGWLGDASALYLLGRS